MNAKSEKDAGAASQATQHPDDHLYSSAAWLWLDEEGLSDENFRHVSQCPACRAYLEAHYYSLEVLRQKWADGAPEREAQVKFSKDCDAWYETWRGKVYLACGGPFWSRRARWLGIPRWEDYKPTTEGKN
ncbi:hypothetical protein HYT05_02895 [Candidatus Kaiserbacteria bacterium]|nr:hypothetical protein [Candidatus Kaiserbacteria bacterium]